MGDPKKLKKKYATPRHPWIAERIEAERELTKEYGLKNKKEIYKMGSVLKKYKDIAKKLIAVKTAQGEKEKKQMLDKLQKQGLVKADASSDEVLSLEMKDIMERRLQSLVFRKGLAKTMNQARQFIIHRHIMVGDKKITFPSYLVAKDEEPLIRFCQSSSLSQEDHPERPSLQKEIKEEIKLIKKEKKQKLSKEEGSEEKILPPKDEEI